MAKAVHPIMWSTPAIARAPRSRWTRTLCPSPGRTLGDAGSTLVMTALLPCSRARELALDEEPGEGDREPDDGRAQRQHGHGEGEWLDDEDKGHGRKRRRADRDDDRRVAAGAGHRAGDRADEPVPGKRRRGADAPRRERD